MVYRVPLVVALLAVPAAAEERTFAVSVAGRPAGEVVLAFKTRADGTTTVDCRTRFKGPPVGPYRERTREVWKDGRLVRLEASGATVREAGRDYHLTAGAKDVTVRGDVWPDTFAVRPAPDHPLVVDVLTGDVSRAKIEKVGPDRVTVAGRPIPATHYRVTAAGRAVDLWYDAAGWLVRREWSQGGDRFVAEWTRN